MGRNLAGLVLWAFAVAAQAQSGTQTPAGTAADPARGAPQVPTPATGTAGPSGQPVSTERGRFIAPVVDIRIQGEGISLPKGLGEPAEKPPAK